MNGFLIASYVLFGIVILLSWFFLVSLAITSKYTIFTKAKYSWPTIVIYSLLFIILLVSGILFLTSLKSKIDLPYLNAGLCFGFLFLDTISIVGYILIVYLSNKHKIDYDKIPTTDFKPALKQIKEKLGNIDEVKAKLNKHHKKYLNNMLLAYSELLKRSKDKNLLKSKKYADIVMFNDTFVHKTSILMNNYHLLLIYEFLTLI